MSRDRLPFRVTQLEARAPEGLVLEWERRQWSTGPLVFSLDDAASTGIVDYGAGWVSVEFRVRVDANGLAGAFCALGIDRRSAPPVRARLWAEGRILPDHSFNGGLRGHCEVESLGSNVPAINVKVLPGL